MNRLPSFKPMKNLTRKEERKLLLKACKGDKEARDFLIENNQYLVLKNANRYRHASGMGWTLEDIIQEGNIGLIIAVDRFDIKRRVRLSTYATWWIRQRISRYLAEKARLVPVPVGVQYKFYHVIDKLKKDPDAKIPKKDLQALKGLGFEIDVTSELSYTPSSIEKTALPERLALHNNELERRLGEIDVEDLFARTEKLTVMQKKVLSLRFGIGGPSYTFEEIGKMLEMSPPSVVQYYNRGLFFLREQLLSENEK